MKLFNILLADDYPIFMEGLQAILQKAAGSLRRYNIYGMARSGRQINELLPQAGTDLLVVDVNLPDTDGLRFLPPLKKNNPGMRVLALSSTADPRVVKGALKAGADGFMLKSGTEDEFMQAVECVADGKPFLGRGLNGVCDPISSQLPDHRFARRYGLTRREIEIMPFIGQALNNKEIAGRLYISDQTVSVHRKNIMRKLGVNNTAGLIKIAYDHNLV
jgi:DNA-binding NarL/FixJ family response regulator